MDIQLASTIQSINKRIINGSVNIEPLVLLDVLNSSIKYAEAKTYTEKSEVLHHKVENLKYQCPDICNNIN